MTTPSTQPPLVDRARSGDGEAFAALVRVHAEPLYRIAVRWTREHHAAEDVVQEAFTALLSSDVPLPADSDVRRWLTRVTRNIAVSGHRRSSAAERTERRAAPAEAVASPDGDIEVRVIAEAVLADLPERESSLMIAHYVDGESLAEIAEQRGTSRDVVKVQLHRARTKARQAARRRGIDGAPTWLPAWLAEAGATVKAVSSTMGAKVAAGLLVPALILGGSLLPGGESADQQGPGPSPVLVSGPRVDGEGALRDPGRTTSSPIETEASADDAAAPTSAPPSASTGGGQRRVEGDTKLSQPIPGTDRTVTHEEFIRPAPGTTSVEVAPGPEGPALAADSTPDRPEEDAAFGAACVVVDPVPDAAARCVSN